MQGESPLFVVFGTIEDGSEHRYCVPCSRDEAERVAGDLRASGRRNVRIEAAGSDATMQPYQGALDVLRAILREAEARDRRGGFFQEQVRMLCRDYGDWLAGKWQPTPGRVVAVFTEHFACAIHEARKAGMQDQAAALVALRPTIVGEERPVTA